MASTSKATLIAQARADFARDGYADVNVVELARAAGVTTGALYHHFQNKRGLFLAVLSEVHEEIAGLVEQEITGLAPWDQLVKGSHAFLEASTEPSRQRIMLVDGPAVFGWETWRKLDAEASVKLLEDVLAQLMQDGVIAPQPLEPLTHLLSGAMNEAALWLATSNRRKRDLAATTKALDRLLESLRA